CGCAGGAAQSHGRAGAREDHSRCPGLDGAGRSRRPGIRHRGAGAAPRRRVTGIVTTPPIESAGRLLRWQAARQPLTLVGGVVFGVLWMLCQVVWPYLLGRAIDAGLASGLTGVAPWAAALAVVAVAQASFVVLRHR